MTPTELLDDHIAIYEHFPHMHRVVPADFVVREALILGRVAVFIANTSESWQFTYKLAPSLYLRGVVSMAMWSFELDSMALKSKPPL